MITKIIERRCVMLGLSAQQTAVLPIVDEATPKEKSLDKIERVIEQFVKDRAKDAPTIHYAARQRIARKNEGKADRQPKN